MAQPRNRYQQMVRYMSIVLILDCLLFALYLLFADLGIVWLKVVLAILVIAVSVLALAFLAMTGEFMRRRSLWLTTGMVAILVCLLVSLFLNYPAPDPQKQAAKTASMFVYREDLPWIVV